MGQGLGRLQPTTTNYQQATSQVSQEGVGTDSGVQSRRQEGHPSPIYDHVGHSMYYCTRTCTTQRTTFGTDCGTPRGWDHGYTEVSYRSDVDRAYSDRRRLRVNTWVKCLKMERAQPGSSTRLSECIVDLKIAERSLIYERKANEELRKRLATICREADQAIQLR